MMTSPYPNRVLIVGPSESMGGIASVMRMHKTTRLWNTTHCEILTTYDERGFIHKVFAMIRAYLLAPLLIRKATLVHIHVAAQHSMMRKLPIALMTKILRKPYVVHLHAASEASLFKLTPGWIVRLMFLLSYRIVVLSDSWATIVKKHIPEARLTIIHNPVASTEVVGIADRSGPPIVLFVGKLEKRKGYREFLDAAAIVLMRFPTTQIWLVGHGEITDAVGYAKSLGIDRSVKCTGWIATDRMENIYRAASIFCLPSHDEGLPMAVLEAMSHSLPVVVTPVGGLPDIISHGRNGLFAEVGNAESISSQILLLLRHPSLGILLGSNASRTISRECGIDRIEQELANLYREVEGEWINRRFGLRETTQY